MASCALIVDDDPVQRKLIKKLIQHKLDFECLEAEHGRIALDMIEADRTRNIKIIILDIYMPVMDGMETLEILNKKHPDLPVIMMTGTNDVIAAVTSMKLGAIDFLTKPYDPERMLVTIKNALKISTLSREVSRLKDEKEGHYKFENLIGHDSGLLQVALLGRKAAPSDLPVLITGETGTGKEVFAKAIHGESKRAGKPFIAVNCGAIPAQLVESTLFGHEKGAFTGATDKVIGKFREADGGTIFLDEVGELPRDAQVKLLRVLQQKEVEPVGAGKPVPVNVRVLSATNLDLEKEVEEGRFREDLFFRLNVMKIELPPLRQRKEDILALATHFVDRFSSQYRTIPKAISKGTQHFLQSYDWPGNVRQLENVMNRALVVSETPALEEEDFDHVLSETPEKIPFPIETKDLSLTISLLNSEGHFKAISDIEREALLNALTYTDQNVTKAAKLLGMAKSTFYKKMKLCP